MDAAERMAAARRSLEGLSVGDAFGECFFPISLDRMSWEMYLSTRTLPNWRWRWTDDTAMGLSIVEVLGRHGRIDQDDLATSFAARYAWDDRRGYGGTAHGILMKLGEGAHWKNVSPAVLGGMGSMGNGGAMRAAPIGAYFADDPGRVAEEARLSAEVTHAHPEGQAGAVGVALAAAWVANHPGAPAERAWEPFFEFVLRHMPDGETRARVGLARNLGPKVAIETAASAVGNGSTITAPETVPYCLWSAARSLDDYVDAMWMTVEGGGDMDTNCAIVGGIVAAGAGFGPPVEWVGKREALPEVAGA